MRAIEPSVSDLTMHLSNGILAQMTTTEYRDLVLAHLKARKQTFYNNGAKRQGRIAANLIATIEDIEIPGEIIVGVNALDGVDQASDDILDPSRDLGTTDAALLDASASE